MILLRNRPIVAIFHITKRFKAAVLQSQWQFYKSMLNPSWPKFNKSIKLSLISRRTPNQTYVKCKRKMSTCVWIEFPFEAIEEHFDYCNFNWVLNTNSKCL